MKSRNFAICARAVCIGALACCASFASSPLWNGTWKLNISRSNIPGPSFLITKLPDGEYHVDTGTYSFKFRCNGKEYPTRNNRTISCTQASPLDMDTTTKDGGKKVGTARWELSADGKAMTIEGTSIRPDGSIKPMKKVYARTSGSLGFAGGWEDTQRLESRPQLILALNQRKLHIAFPGGQYMDPPLDGTDALCHGAGVPQGLTMAIKPIGPRQFLYVKKLAGKIVNRGSLRLSADGRILTEEYWNPSRPDQKAVLVYEKR